MKQFLNLLIVLLVSTIGLTAQDLQEGLVIHYPFEGNLTDTISGTTAENFGNLTFTDDNRVGNQAVRFFTGTGDPYFVTPSGALQVGPEADGGTAGTFALFVNHRAAPLETDRHNYIAQKNLCGPDDNNRGRVVLYRQNPADDDDADELISFISGRPLRSEYVLDTADTWVHIALTMNPEEREFAFFINGEEVARDTFPGTAQAENSCGEFVIGHHLTFTNESQTFDGLMDDLRFYNRVLSDEEIVLLSQQFPTATREEVVTNAIKVVPNPVATDQELTVAIDRGVFRAGSAIRLNVVDVSGRTVLQREYDAVTNQLRLDHNLTSGVYTVTITDGERLATTKLVVR